MRWAAHVAWVRGEKKYRRVWWKRPKERVHSEERGVDRTMGSEWILERLAEGVWSGFNWLRIGNRWQAFVIR
jgi:hypothetical protein